MNDVFTGPDSKPSGRRIIGTLLIVLGGALLVVGQLQTGDVVGRIAAGSIALLAGALFWGLVTWQNIQDAAKAVKGGQ